MTSIALALLVLTVTNKSPIYQEKFLPLPSGGMKTAQRMPVAVRAAILQRRKLQRCHFRFMAFNMRGWHAPPVTMRTDCRWVRLQMAVAGFPGVPLPSMEAMRLFIPITFSMQWTVSVAILRIILGVSSKMALKPGTDSLILSGDRRVLQLTMKCFRAGGILIVT